MRAARVSNSFLPKPKRVISVNAHTQSTGGGEALLVGGSLVVGDDVVAFQTGGNLGTGGVTHRDDDLVGLGVANGGIACHIQTFRLQALGKVLGVFHHGLPILVLELVHLIGGHQQTQHGAQVVVGHAAGGRCGSMVSHRPYFRSLLS